MRDPLRAATVRAQQAVLEMLEISAKSVSDAISAGIVANPSALAAISLAVDLVKAKTFLEYGHEPSISFARSNPEAYAYAQAHMDLAIEDQTRMQDVRAREVVLQGVSGNNPKLLDAGDDLFEIALARKPNGGSS